MDINNWQEEHKKKMEELEANLPAKISDTDKELINLIPFKELPVLDHDKSSSYKCYLTAFSTDLQDLIGNEYPAKQIGEIAFSYLQNKSSILDAYNILETYSASVKDLSDGYWKVKNCSILLKDIIISIKTAVDSICVFLQLLEKENITYTKYTDINSYCGEKNGIRKGINSSLIAKVREIKCKPWFIEVSEIRNKVIHRGYTLESDFQYFFKENEQGQNVIQQRFCLPRHTDSIKSHNEFESFDNRSHYRKIDLNPIIKGFLELEHFEKELIETLISETLSNGVTIVRFSSVDQFRNMNL